MKEEMLKPFQPFENSPPPSPIEERECACGCGHKFVPKRRDQIYLNRQHANFGYNHGKRKKNAKAEVEIQKKLRINDKVLEKHFRLYDRKEAVCFLTILKADGFSEGYYYGRITLDNQVFCFSYNYLFSIYQESGHKLIKIRKK